MTIGQGLGIETDAWISSDAHRRTRNILAGPIVEIQPWSEVCTVFTPEVLDDSGAAASPVIL